MDWKNRVMLILRRATAEDEQRLLTWRNEAATRAASFSSGEISLQDHRNWFRRKLADPGCRLLIAEESSRPVGQVRLDRIDADAAEISIGLAPEFRGRGLGREALRLAASYAANELGARRLMARVKLANGPSLAVFRAAGYRVSHEDREVVEFLLDIEPDPPTGQRRTLYGLGQTHRRQPRAG
jgi:RimJ/RimL family protein N-acetyltransferase